MQAGLQASGPPRSAFPAACSSPSAWITLARRSRSASACLAIARIIWSGKSTFLTSTACNLDAPGLRLLVEGLLNACVQLLPLAEQLIEVGLAKNRPQARLCKLGGARGRSERLRRPTWPGRSPGKRPPR